MAVRQDTTRIVREGVERACRDFTDRLVPLGFARTRKMLWVRLHALTADVIHLHRGGSSYGKPINYSVDFRMHLAIRVSNERRDWIHLNGPNSDRVGGVRYHLRFNARSGSTYERCIEDLVRFATDQGEPWFLAFRDVETLLSRPDSPLDPGEKESLRAATAGRVDAEAVSVSMRVLGVKQKRP